MTRPCIALLVIALAGCAATTADRPRTAAPDADAVMVIGRVDGRHWIVAGRYMSGIPVAKAEFFDRMHSIWLTVRQWTTARTYDIVCDEKGGNVAHFYAALPPGRYTVTRIRKGEGPVQPSPMLPYEMRFSLAGRRSRSDPEGREPTFEVARPPAGSPPAVIYIGTLEVSRQQDYMAPSKNFMTGDTDPGFAYSRGWRVKDEYDEMVKTFRRKYPQATQPISKSLMQD